MEQAADMLYHIFSNQLGKEFSNFSYVVLWSRWSREYQELVSLPLLLLSSDTYKNTQSPLLPSDLASHLLQTHPLDDKDN